MSNSQEQSMKDFMRNFSVVPPRQKSAVVQIVHLLAEPFVQANQTVQEEPGLKFSY